MGLLAGMLWTAAHRRIEALDREHENIQLVPYRALTSEARGVVGGGKRIGIEPTQCMEIRLSAETEPPGSVRDEPGSREPSTSIFSSIRERANHWAWA